MLIELNPPVEARAWLRDNPNPSALATNRFGRTERALEFVARLYEAGAERVLVDNPQTDSRGRPYADTLLVLVPADSPARRDVEELCEQEGPTEVPGDFTMDLGEREIRLWWD